MDSGRDDALVAPGGPAMDPRRFDVLVAPGGPAMDSGRDDALVAPGGPAIDPRRFDVLVAPDGYTWWYLDALSDDGARGLTIIVFLGSVFSPYYAHARHRAARRGEPGADPLDHSAFNVALYGAGGARWSMTERGRHDVRRDATRLAIGPSAIEWVGDALRLTVDEVGAPIPQRIRGTIDVRSDGWSPHRVSLDAAGRHQWGVIAPSARVDVRLEDPALSWSGSAYFDSNRGIAPLEQDFARWNWSRAHLADGRTAVVYDIERRRGSPLHIADRFAPDGSFEPFTPPPVTALPRTLWGLDRSTRADAGTVPTVDMRLEDGPFYSRSVVSSRWLGQPVRTVHEFLCLDRFDRRWVRAMLPFRVPRRFV